MTGVRIHLFGQTRVEHPDLALCLSPPRASRWLLAFLILKCERAHGRDALLGAFWPETEERQARRCLSSALWRLRQVLEPPAVTTGTYLSVNGSDEVGFNFDSDSWIDFKALEQALGAIAHMQPEDCAPATLRSLEQVASLYSGDVLEGCDLEWALEERERVQASFCGLLDWLVAALRARGDHRQALRHAVTLLRFNPYREDVTRTVMALHWLNGDRASAVLQYRRFKAFLARELEVEPMAETQDLVRTILSGPVSAPVRSGLHPPGLSKQATNRAGRHLLKARRMYKAADQHVEIAERLIADAGEDLSDDA